MKTVANIRIATFGMLNNPEYREEPWRESIAQKLDFFDAVCLVCGNEPDVAMLREAFPLEWASGKLKAIYKPWPFPEWSYEELPRHLNAAFALAKETGCDWLVKLDIDTVFHEKDKGRFHRALAKATKKDRWIVSVQKLQFFSPVRYWKKAHLPIALSATAPIVYGFDTNKYTDLCQPIVWDGKSTVVQNGKTYDIPAGPGVPVGQIMKVWRTKLFNYDFTFRTLERSVELLYQIEMAHARFWGKGYEGRPIETITRETSMEDFLRLSRQRFSKMKKRMSIKKHPRHFQAALQNLQADKWGNGFWGRL